MSRAGVLRALVVCAAAFCAAFAYADRETAEFFAERAAKALRAKDYEEAAKHYRRALSESADYLPAQFGLADALLGAKQRDEAIEQLRAGVAAAEALDDVPRAWRSAVDDARKRLASLDVVGNELRKIEDDHVAALVAFARKWRKKDTEVTEKALRQVLVIRPGHAKATDLIESMGLSAKGVARSLFDGRTLAGWTDMGFPDWQAKDGAIVAEVHDSAYMGRTDAVFEGDFDVRMEAKLIKEHTGPWLFGLCPAYDGKYSHYTLGLFRGRILWQDDFPVEEKESDREIVDMSPSSLAKKFDKYAWNTFELRFRGGVVHALVNGEEVGQEERPAHRAGGFLGLKAQNCNVAFRAIEILVR